MIMPETWLPTWTSMTGVKLPLAVTTWVISPLVIAAVLKSNAASFGRVT